ncbi:hypothetical protein Ndes2526B_g04819 [Nannochloris sp. 'desiccata']
MLALLFLVLVNLLLVRPPLVNDTFKERFCEHFAPPNGERSTRAALRAHKQRGPVTKYYYSLKRLSCQVNGLTETELLNIFLDNLDPEIHHMLTMHYEPDLMAMLKKAFRAQEKVKMANRKNPGSSIYLDISQRTSRRDWEQLACFCLLTERIFPFASLHASLKLAYPWKSSPIKPKAGAFEDRAFRTVSRSSSSKSPNWQYP